MPDWAGRMASIYLRQFVCMSVSLYLCPPKTPEREVTCFKMWWKLVTCFVRNFVRFLTVNKFSSSVNN